MRSQQEHLDLLQRLQSELFVDDLEPPRNSIEWSEARLRAWFEAGGVEAASLRETDVKIPRDGSQPLDGKLLWPQDHSAPALILLWCSANPSKGFGAEHMESNVPAAIATECSTVGLALLRFNFSGVRGSGGCRLDPSQTFHPTARDEVQMAFDFLKSRGCKRIALGGHSMGASMLLPTAAKEVPAAVVCSAYGPLVYKVVPHDQREKLRASMLDEVERLPAVPKMFIVGSNDTISPKHALEEFTMSVKEPKILKCVAGANHNFEGHEHIVARLIVNFVFMEGQ
ncbi:hypothetical protein AB1Y20_021234 [Prymnesium parvum]|uniref:KANL3/Tex30 alpha/beta hydrolase-like domain-containing protein n=1 Tax=Prymnesium parvum TaxID=97485 RepID=A0AB34JKY7_PRYPA